MPKFRRLVVPGHPHHITQRGVRRQRIFFNDHHYRTYLSIAKRFSLEVDIEIWAYCLMPNHIHAVVVPGNSLALARFFGSVHHEYAIAINAENQWSGHLWQGRFHSVVMQEEHTLAAMRYVELNPVRSGLCEQPRDWPWSSARGNLGETTDPLVNSKTPHELVDSWHNYLSESEDAQQLESLRQRTRTGRPTGTDEFIDFLESSTGRTIRITKAGRKKLGDRHL